jgi:hydrogenase maturation protease
LTTTTTGTLIDVPSRVLVGGLGYQFLRDESVGPYMVERLAARAPDGVEVEDLSYHPVGLVHNLQARPRYDRMVVVAAARRGHPPGTIRCYRWDRSLPSREEIQARVSEAVTGVISLDNLLVVCEALGALPDDVRVVEVEPGAEGWGEGFSEAMRLRLDEIEEAVWSSAKL